MAGSITRDSFCRSGARVSANPEVRTSGSTRRRVSRNDEVQMTPRAATLIGLTAILMWSLLSALTVATGKIPPFQLAAMTFLIGSLVGFLTWIGRPNAINALSQPPLAWLVGVGGLFG